MSEDIRYGVIVVRFKEHPNAHYLFYEVYERRVDKDGIGTEEKLCWAPLPDIDQALKVAMEKRPALKDNKTLIEKLREGAKTRLKEDGDFVEWPYEGDLAAIAEASSGD